MLKQQVEKHEKGEPTDQDGKVQKKKQNDTKGKGKEKEKENVKEAAKQKLRVKEEAKPEKDNRLAEPLTPMGKSLPEITSSVVKLQSQLQKSVAEIEEMLKSLKLAERGTLLFAGSCIAILTVIFLGPCRSSCSST